MKAGISFFLYTLLFLSISVGSPLDVQSSFELQKANEYLQNRGELFFKFKVESPSILDKITHDISIDKVEGLEVFAYANQDELEAFQKHGIPFVTQTPPSLTGEKPQMSDYADYVAGKAQAEWDKYPTYNAYLDIVKGFETKFPQFCKVSKIGESVKNREILAVKVSSNVDKDEKEPKFLATGTIHGDELLGYMLLMRMIDYLCSNYQQNQTAKKVLDSTELWIIPLANPDGTYSGGNNTVWNSRRQNANGQDLNRNHPDPSRGWNVRLQKETKVLCDFDADYNFIMGLDIHGGMENIVYPFAYARKKPVDEQWWKYIALNYVQEARKVSSNYLSSPRSSGLGSAGIDYYTAQGTRIDYPYYHRHNRCVTLELNSRKKLPENQLNQRWNYNKNAIIGLFLEMLNGLRGTITDKNTGRPVKAKVFVENLDRDSSFTYSGAKYGDYYRPLYEGNYSVTYSADSCEEQTIRNIRVRNGVATVKDVELNCDFVGIKNDKPIYSSAMSITKSNTGVLIKLAKSAHNRKVLIYSLQGQLVQSLIDKNKSGTLFWDYTNQNNRPVGNGCYLIHVDNVLSGMSRRITISR